MPAEATEPPDVLPVEAADDRPKPRRPDRHDDRRHPASPGTVVLAFAGVTLGVLVFGCVVAVVAGYVVFASGYPFPAAPVAQQPATAPATQRNPLLPMAAPSRPAAPKPAPAPPTRRKTPEAEPAPPPDTRPPLVRSIPVSGETVWSVAFGGDGGTLVTGGRGLYRPGHVNLWDAATGKSLGTLLSPSSEVFVVAFSPDGTLVASATSNEGVQLLDPKTKQVVATLRHPSYVRAVAFSPDGSLVASHCERELRVWGVKAAKTVWTAPMGRELRTWRIGTRLAFSPDGKTLAVGDGDRGVNLYDAATGKPAGHCSGHKDLVLSTAFSPDGKLLASGSKDHTVRLWDAATCRELATLSGPDPNAWYYGVAFAPGGGVLAGCGGGGGTVTLWEVPGGKELASWKSNTKGKGEIGAAFSPDGKTLATSGEEGTVSLWDVSKLTGR